MGEKIKNNNPEGSGEERKILIDKSTWEDVLARLEKLEKGQGEPQKPYAEEVKEDVVRLRKVDGKYVVGFQGKIYERWDEKLRSHRLTVDLLLVNEKNEKGTKTVDYIDFLEKSEIVEAKVLKRERKQRVQREGTVEVKKEKDYKMVGTGVTVPVEIISYDEIMTVQLPDGKKLRINALSVNL